MVGTTYVEEDSGFLLDKLNHQSDVNFKRLEFVSSTREVYQEEELLTLLSKIEEPQVDIYYKDESPILQQSISEKDHLFELIELDKSLPVALRNSIHSIYF